MLEYEIVSVAAWRRERDDAAVQVRTVREHKAGTRTPQEWSEETPRGSHAAPVIPAGATFGTFAAHQYGHASRPYMYRNDVAAAEHAPRYQSEAQFERDMIAEGRKAAKTARQSLKTRGHA